MEFLNGARYTHICKSVWVNAGIYRDIPKRHSFEIYLNSRIFLLAVMIDCPSCNMVEIVDHLGPKKVKFEAYSCNNCGEEIMDMKQLKNLANAY